MGWGSRCLATPDHLWKVPLRFVPREELQADGRSIVANKPTLLNVVVDVAIDAGDCTDAGLRGPPRSVWRAARTSDSARRAPGAWRPAADTGGARLHHLSAGRLVRSAPCCERQQHATREVATRLTGERRARAGTAAIRHAGMQAGHSGNPRPAGWQRDSRIRDQHEVVLTAVRENAVADDFALVVDVIGANTGCS